MYIIGNRGPENEPGLAYKIAFQTALVRVFASSSTDDVLQNHSLAESNHAIENLDQTCNYKNAIPSNKIPYGDVIYYQESFAPEPIGQ